MKISDICRFENKKFNFGQTYNNFFVNSNDKKIDINKLTVNNIVNLHKKIRNASELKKLKIADSKIFAFRHNKVRLSYKTTFSYNIYEIEEIPYTDYVDVYRDVPNPRYGESGVNNRTIRQKFKEPVTKYRIKYHFRESIEDVVETGNLNFLTFNQDRKLSRVTKWNDINESIFGDYFKKNLPSFLQTKGKKGFLGKDLYFELNYLDDSHNLLSSKSLKKISNINDYCENNIGCKVENNLLEFAKDEPCGDDIGKHFDLTNVKNYIKDSIVKKYDNRKGYKSKDFKILYEPFSFSSDGIYELFFAQSFSIKDSYWFYLSNLYTGSSKLIKKKSNISRFNFQNQNSKTYLKPLYLYLIVSIALIFFKSFLLLFNINVSNSNITFFVGLLFVLGFLCNGILSEVNKGISSIRDDQIKIIKNKSTAQFLNDIIDLRVLDESKKEIINRYSIPLVYCSNLFNSKKTKFYTKKVLLSNWDLINVLAVSYPFLTLIFNIKI